MPKISLSFVVPTTGRASLYDSLFSISSQTTDFDEVIVVGDGTQPMAAEITRQFDSRFRYYEHGPTNCYGNAQRDFGILQATGTHVAFMDDDDVYLSGGIHKIKAAIVEHPENPLLFRMRHHGRILWSKQSVEFGNVSTQMFVVPRILEKLGKWAVPSWDDGHACDFLFIEATIKLWPEGALVWREDVVAELVAHNFGR